MHGNSANPFSCIYTFFAGAALVTPSEAHGCARPRRRFGYKLRMNVGAVGAVSQGGAVYALSPFLSGTVRTSDAAAAAATAAPIATAVTRAQPADATAVAAPTSPFLNPAIADIAVRATVVTSVAGTAVVATPAATAPTQSTSPIASLQGDSGLLIQSYGAVALIVAPLTLAPLFTQPAPLAIPPVAPVPAIQRPNPVPS
jgi:hypothetical protein